MTKMQEVFNMGAVDCRYGGQSYSECHITFLNVT